METEGRVGTVTAQSMAAKSILLIDDDIELGQAMREFFGRRQIELQAVADPRRGLALALAGGHDLILLDVMMPGLDGLELLRSLRRSSLVPVIMLTAKTRQMDRVAGLDAGADDYLPKPFGPEELLARIRAVLRRTSQIPETTEPLEVGGLTLIPGSREVRLGQVLIGLTSIEYDLFEILIRSAGRTVTREALTAAIYRRQVSPFDRAVDMHVSNLRKKLGAKGALIRTIRGLGYLFSTGRGPDESGVTEPSDGPTRTPHPNPPPLRGEGTRKDDGSLASDSVSPCGEGSGWGVEGLATPGASATIKESGS